MEKFCAKSRLNFLSRISIGRAGTLQGIGKVGKVPLDCQLARVLIQTRGVRGFD